MAVNNWLSYTASRHENYPRQDLLIQVDSLAFLPEIFFSPQIETVRSISAENSRSRERLPDI